MSRYLAEYKKSSIIVRWQMSFELIQRMRPSATDLLSLMSFFDRQGIPEHVLRSRGNQEDSDSKQKRPTGGHVNSTKDDDVSQSSVSDGELKDDTSEVLGPSLALALASCAPLCPPALTNPHLLPAQYSYAYGRAFPCPRRLSLL